MARRPLRRHAVVELDRHEVDTRLALLQLADSALPVGTFAHSFGFESALSAGWVRDEVGVAAWLEQYVRRQLVTTDLLAIRRVYDLHDSESSGAGLAELDDALTALTLASEAREASRTMAARLMELATECFASPSLLTYADRVAEGRCHGHYPIVYGATLAGLGVGLDEALLTYAGSVVIGLTQNAVRAVPLGAAAGQRIITRLHPTIAQAVADAGRLPIDRLGASTPHLEIAQMRHEHQHARMFSS